jgi:hypothetical protein
MLIRAGSRLHNRSNGRLLDLGSYRPVTQSQPPPRAQFCVRTRPVAGWRCELWFGCRCVFDRRAVIVGFFRTFLRKIGGVAGFIFDGERSSYTFECFHIGKICVKRLGFFGIFCIDSRSAGLKLALDPVDIVSCKVPHGGNRL